MEGTAVASENCHLLPGAFAQSARNAVAPWISFWSPQTLKISCLPPFAVANAVFWIAGKFNQICRSGWSVKAIAAD